MPIDEQENFNDLITGKKTGLFCTGRVKDVVAFAQNDSGVHMNSGSEIANTINNAVPDAYS